MIKREQATAEDKAYFKSLNKLSYKQLVVEQFGLWDDKSQDEYFDKKWEEQAWQKIIHNGVLVGGIWTDEFTEYIQLREILIHPAHQNQGIGTTLLREEIDRAKLSRKELRLRVLLKSRAIKLYKRLGLENISHDDTHYYMVYYT